MQKSKFVWALVDNRTGNRNQILGVLSQLNLKYKVIEVKYNSFAFLPNFLFQILNKNIHIKSLKGYLEKPYPDIIISCGRRTATVSLELNKLFNFKPLCFHLMYPRFTFFKNNFSLIFTPKHDKVKKNKFIKKFLGSPSNIELLANIKHKYFNPIIFLIIGGDHGNYKLSTSEVEKLITSIFKKIKRKGTLLITTSRRTSEIIINKIDNLAKNNYSIKEVYHPNKYKNKNPYIRYLSIADEIVVTGDSMSMISDACETRKPVRIYYNNSFCSNKHIKFCENLIEENYAFSFDTLGEKCKILKVLNTSKKIALEIKKKLENE